MVGGELDPDRHRPDGVDRELDRRLAAAAAQPPGLDQEILAHQIVDDVGDRLRGEPRQPADLGAPQRPMRADRLQHHAPVVPPVALGIAADRQPRRNVLIAVPGHLPC